jgi:hypothetical protein
VYCKAHFHQFAVIISPFHAVGMDAMGSENLHLKKMEAPPPLGAQAGRYPHAKI